MFSNEACFHLNGYVNWHKTMHWVQDNPHAAADHQTNPRITVWCAVHGDPLLGPVFPDGVMNTEWYLQFLNNALETYMYIRHSQLNIGFPFCRMEHHLIAMARCKTVALAGQQIGCTETIEWPRRYLGLIAIYFYLWGHLNPLVYHTHPP
jgi:hypothetical protein